MEVKSLGQQGKIIDKSIDAIRHSQDFYKEDLPMYVKYKDKFYPIDKKVTCVIYGDGAPISANQRRAEINKQKSPNIIKRNQYRQKHINKSPENKLKFKLRGIVHNAFYRAAMGGYVKSEKCESILGCTMGEFIDHLSLKFKEGMCLKNHGEWHLDHIKPMKLAKTEDEIYRLYHYTNFQPLWAIDNRKKSAKYEQ